MSEERKAREWKTVPELRGTGLERLFKDLREAEVALEDAVVRVEAIRALIQPSIESLDFPVRVGNRQVAWRPETETERLDASLLARAGVTPDQLAAGTKKGMKKGYMEIRTLKEEAATETAQDVALPTMTAPALPLESDQPIAAAS